MIESEILQALQDALKAAVAASSTPALPIAFVGLTFTTPNDQKFLEVIYLPNNPADRYWGDDKDFQGIFRFILHWPIGTGAYPALATLASIASYFSKGRVLDGGLRVTSNPDLTSAVRGDADMLYPATLRYQRYSPVG